jgi:Zn-dependent M28 family amino/carboxypeptidase
MTKNRLLPAAMVAILAAACTTDGRREGPGPQDLSAALAAIDGGDILVHIKVLASDDFEGRAPGTRGETLTVDYLVAQFKALGLAPGNPDGTYVQRVPFTGFTAVPVATARIAGKTLELKAPFEFVARAPRREEEVRIENSPLVFVGYGIVAPEYGWDDYKAMDLRGKTLVVLVNDPPIPDPNDPAKLDEKMFKGKAMTYYGRWTYKYEMGAKLGAASVLIVHETGPAAYPYAVVINSFGREVFELRSATPDSDLPVVPGWLHLDKAKEIFAASGRDFDAMKKAALGKDFKPVPLDGSITFSVRNWWRDTDSQNVVARLEGSDPKLKDEYVVYTAHWDHLGWNPRLPGNKRDQVYHGALDNASGIGALLSLAKAFRALPRAPRRSILFVATTGEEQGLLGARYYARHPLYPLQRTLANINIDGVNAWGPTRDVTLVGGMGRSSLDEMVIAAAATQGRWVRAESRPEFGGFYRSDHFEFAKEGVPAVFLGRGSDFIGKPADFDKHLIDTYVANDYHKPTDNVRDDWDFSGAVQDMQLAFRLGYDLAEADAYPRWKPGSEFTRR